MENTLATGVFMTIISFNLGFLGYTTRDKDFWISLVVLSAGFMGLSQFIS